MSTPIRISPTFNTQYAITSLDTENASESTGVTGSICTLGGVSIGKDLYVGGNIFGAQFIPTNPGSYGNFLPNLVAANTTFDYSSGFQHGYYYTLGNLICFQIALNGTYTSTSGATNYVTITNLPFQATYGRASSICGSVAGDATFQGGTSPPYNITIQNTTLTFYSGTTKLSVGTASAQTFDLSFNGSFLNTTTPNVFYPSLSFEGASILSYGVRYGYWNSDGDIITIQYGLEGTRSSSVGAENIYMQGLPSQVGYDGFGFVNGQASNAGLSAGLFQYYLQPVGGGTSATFMIQRLNPNVGQTAANLRAASSSSIVLYGVASYPINLGTASSSMTMVSANATFASPTQSSYYYVSGDVTYVHFAIDGTYTATGNGTVQINNLAPFTNGGALYGVGVCTIGSYFNAANIQTPPFTISLLGTTGYVTSAQQTPQPNQVAPIQTDTTSSVAYGLHGSFCYFSGAGTSWSPVVTAAKGTFNSSFSTGKYQRTGNKIVAHFRCTGTYTATHPTQDGYPLQITGLPYPVVAGSPAVGVCSYDSLVETNATGFHPLYFQNFPVYNVIITGSTLSFTTTTTLNNSFPLPINCQADTSANYTLAATITYLITPP
jgi:hypothetical protein